MLSQEAHTDESGIYSQRDFYHCSKGVWLCVQM